MKINEITKRIEIIKLANLLKDEKTIEIQIKHLINLKADKLIEKLFYKEIKVLNKHKEECLTKIVEFNKIFKKRVGSIILETLNLKKTILFYELNKINLELDENKSKFSEIDREIEDIKEIIQQLKHKLEKSDVFDLKYDNLLEELSETKKIYEEKVKEMEIFKDELKLIEKDQQTMKKYNLIQDISKKFNSVFKDNSFDEFKINYNKFEIHKIGLQEFILKETRYIIELEEELELLKNNRIYNYIESITDLDYYFNNLFHKIETEKQQLEIQKDKLLQSIDIEEIDEYQFWHNEF